MVKAIIEGAGYSSERAQELLRLYWQELYSRTSRLFALLLIGQFVLALLVAIVWSPLAWEGTQASIHFHVWLALGLGGIILSWPLFLGLTMPGDARTRHVIAIGQMAFGALLIHLTGGRIETHFHVFASLAFLAFYRDVSVLRSAVIFTIADHLLRGIFWPRSVYGLLSVTPWRTLEHFLWVVFEVVILRFSILQSIREMAKICDSQAEQERTTEIIEQEVEERTRELQETDEKLRESLAAFRDIQMALDEHAIVSIANTKGEIVFVNDKFCEISNYSVEELLGQDHRIVNSGLHSKEFFRELWRAISQGKVWKGEICNRRKDGILYWVDSTIVPFMDGSNRPYQYVSIRTDITQRKLAEQVEQQLLNDLSKSNQELSEFAYVVSHDLKAPLRGVTSIARFLESDYRDVLGEEGAEQIKLLVGRVDRMHHLIEGLLQYAKIGREKIEKQVVDLNDLVSDVVDSLSLGDNVRIVLDTSLPMVIGEAVRLRQVFQNLLSNAVKYNDKATAEINIGMMTEDRACCFYVRDNGPGIDAKYFTKIFQLFQTLQSRDSFESTGVGLALVKKIVEGYGGKIWVESELGVGTTFWFTLEAEQKDGIMGEQGLERVVPQDATHLWNTATLESTS